MKNFKVKERLMKSSRREKVEHNPLRTDWVAVWISFAVGAALGIIIVELFIL